MRGLSKEFLTNLKDGDLAPLVQAVRSDKDLDFEIRDNYFNIYYKGNSLLRLRPNRKPDIHHKFTQRLAVPEKLVADTVSQFIDLIPALKANIIIHGKHSLETEYEQLIIRANNFEERNNTDFLIVDRQYAIDGDRYDLTGIYWERTMRSSKKYKAPICLLEIKFALNNDIKDIAGQVERYYHSIKKRPAEIAEEVETMFRQKVELGLYHCSTEQLNAMKQLSCSPELDDFQFIIVLVDYNPNSSRFNPDSLRALPFANQIRIFKAGFGMWQQDLQRITPR